jgi:hypothetical protein
MTNIRFYPNVNKKPKEPVDVILLIFKHDAVVFDFEPSMADKVYNFNYNLYYDTEGFEEKDTLSGLFLDNMLRAEDLDKAIMVINYNPNIAVIAKAVIDAIEKKEPGYIFCLSFFHDDVITSNLRKKTRTFNMLNYKFSTIESMIDYPFIKKYDIPYNLCLTEEYLADIVSDIY